MPDAYRYVFSPQMPDPHGKVRRLHAHGVHPRQLSQQLVLGVQHGLDPGLYGYALVRIKNCLFMSNYPPINFLFLL